MFRILQPWKHCSSVSTTFAGVCFPFVNDKDLSEDIVQDVFYELWKRRESIRFEDESVKSYLFKAVYTHALNALDKKQQDVYPLKPERETDILDQYVFLLYAKIPSRACY